MPWQRTNSAQVVNAHSLYLEVLGELGIVGLVLVVVVLALILGAFAFRARGPDRALFAALLAAGLAWAVHAGVDWDWQIPAVTLWLFALGGAALARSVRRRRRSNRRDVRNGVLRVGGVVACLTLAILPARVALSQARLDSAIGAMYGGHCGQARAEAGSSLSAEGERPTPYMVSPIAMWRKAATGQRWRRWSRPCAEIRVTGSCTTASPWRGRGPAWIPGRRARAAARSVVLVPPTPGDP